MNDKYLPPATLVATVLAAIISVGLALHRLDARAATGKAPSVQATGLNPIDTSQGVFLPGCRAYIPAVVVGPDGRQHQIELPVAIVAGRLRWPVYTIDEEGVFLKTFIYPEPLGWRNP